MYNIPMKVEITKDKPKCSICLYSTPVSLGTGFFCDKKCNIVEEDLTCWQYAVAIDKVADTRRHTQDFDKLDLGAIEIEA